MCFSNPFFILVDKLKLKLNFVLFTKTKSNYVKPYTSTTTTMVVNSLTVDAIHGEHIIVNVCYIVDLISRSTNRYL